MFFSGTAFPALRGNLKTSGLALVAALMLSACVDPITGLPVEGTSAAGTAAPPLPKADDNLYVAKSDGSFTVPALPIEEIPEPFRRQVVDYETDQAPGTIIIDPRQKVLYYVMNKRKALRYGIAVGADGFGWSGEALVSEKKQWPTWTPPKEMIERKPELKQWEEGQPGGPTNPLGARAIYLLSNGIDYGYRIHGTPDWKSIGRNASSGCFRMINQDVMDLYERIKGGEKVIVLTASGEMPTGLSIPKPPEVKKKAAAPVKAAAPIVAPPLVVLPPPTIAGGPGVTPAAATAAPGPTAAPAVAPAAAPVCAVPLVNGICPKG